MMLLSENKYGDDDDEMGSEKFDDLFSNFHTVSLYK